MDYKLPKGYIDLIEKKYNLKVLDLSLIHI